jgi:hypothetical protein
VPFYLISVLLHSEIHFMIRNNSESIVKTSLKNSWNSRLTRRDFSYSPSSGMGKYGKSKHGNNYV